MIAMPARTCPDQRGCIFGRYKVGGEFLHDPAPPPDVGGRILDLAPPGRHLREGRLDEVLRVMTVAGEQKTPISATRRSRHARMPRTPAAPSRFPQSPCLLDSYDAPGALGGGKGVRQGSRAAPSNPDTLRGSPGRGAGRPAFGPVRSLDRVDADHLRREPQRRRRSRPGTERGPHRSTAPEHATEPGITASDRSTQQHPGRRWAGTAARSSRRGWPSPATSPAPVAERIWAVSLGDATTVDRPTMGFNDG
jgi:hypothetical protein